MRRVVVLPQPDGPSRLVNDPAGIARFMSSTATTLPKRFVTPMMSTSGWLPPEVPTRTLNGAGPAAGDGPDSAAVAGTVTGPLSAAERGAATGRRCSDAT